MPTNYITLTRQKLYEMVWSEPMISLAKSFGISDVALAKRCRAVNVPIPSATGRVRPRPESPAAAICANMSRCLIVVSQPFNIGGS